jgi:RNA polymerase sigma factor (sigma-70 family)
MEGPTTAPIPESVGLFGRLFSRKPKVSRPIPMARPAEIEATVDEVPALQAAEPPVADEEMVRTDEHAEPAPDDLHSPAPVAEVPSIPEEPEFLEEPVAQEQHVFGSVDEALPAAQRRVVELAYFGDYTQTEIAKQLEVPLGTVKGRARLALEKLPNRLAAYRAPVASAGARA